MSPLPHTCKSKHTCMYAQPPKCEQINQQIRVESLKLCVSSNINQPIFQQSSPNLSNSSENVNKKNIHKIENTRPHSTARQVVRNTQRRVEWERKSLKCIEISILVFALRQPNVSNQIENKHSHKHTTLNTIGV